MWKLIDAAGKCISPKPRAKCELPREAIAIWGKRDSVKKACLIKENYEMLMPRN